MITIAKTSSLCPINQIVPRIYLWSHVWLPAEFNLNRSTVQHRLHHQNRYKQ